MKVIGITCSAAAESVSAALVKKTLEGAAAAGHETVLYELGKAEAYGCRACAACKKGAPECVINDALKPYWQDLQQADAVVFGAGIYMGNVQAQGHVFMNRHYCLTGGDRALKIAAGKKFISYFSQGYKDPEFYRALCENFVKCFTGWKFAVAAPVIAAGGASEEQLRAAYETGKSL